MTLISPVIECGPHDIEFLKPVKIIVPHCLDLSKAKKEWVTVYRCERFHGHGHGLSWEKVPNEWEKSSQSKAWFTVKQDSIHIRTKNFSLWSFFACGGPRRKRATVFASKPDPKSDLIYLRFYVYSDNEDSKRVGDLLKGRNLQIALKYVCDPKKANPYSRPSMHANMNELLGIHPAVHGLVYELTDGQTERPTE